MFQKKIKFKNSKGLKLAAIYEGEDENAPAVVMCHGYGSSKDSKSTKLLSEKLTAIGLSVYRFDFLGCGSSDGELENLTPEEGIDDLKSAVKDLNKDRYALYGSSYGGFITLIYASANSLSALALKAPVSDYFSIMKAKGNEKENKTEKFEEQAKKFNLYKDAEKITCPTFVVHGSEDYTVPLSQSVKLLENLGGERQLVIIHGATHDIDGANLENATTQISEFFRNKLL